MTDGIIKGTGNSRYLRGPANIRTLYPTYDDLLDALAAGTLPIDLNGINPAGWDVVGDKLDKATLLTDALCTALGLATSATPTQAMDKLRQLAQIGIDQRAQLSLISYVGTGNTSATKPITITFPFAPKILALFEGMELIMFTQSSRYIPQITTTDLLTTAYQDRVLWLTPSNSGNWSYHRYAKKSADGKIISWYSVASVSGDTNTTFSSNMNEVGITYKCLALS